ncbi:M28 family peptidase [Pontibacter sp. KCTC 32443]|uniref:M28 family peptidase n=1 Tax=Pontibacter TaxID=323449 RepID=UPI00164D4F27|nr:MULTISPECIES: M28 family peptidase [Pontibacter]MBC5776003.1 M28 family peptidase [Pontibacter sp. KCTC 32443]
MKGLLVLLICMLTATSVFAGKADTVKLRQHLIAITGTSQPRNHQHTAALDEVATYIKKEFEKLQGQVQEQVYTVAGKEYRNIILSMGPADAPRLIVGAHYDVCGDQPGADDNASGVAGLLELARLLHNHRLPFRIDLVAYTLEEPPYFRTEHMGSYVHARSLKEQQAEVKGMISLEMIGNFKDEKGTQRYPLAPMKLFYGSRGNYIAVVQRFGNGSFGRSFLRNYKNNANIPVKSLRAPAFVTGVDFSDHLNYWHFGFDALMITDTSFYRNSNYHQPTDTIYTLDFRRMARVVDAVYTSILNL